jgi:hypothetical protein
MELYSKIRVKRHLGVFTPLSHGPWGGGGCMSALSLSLYHLHAYTSLARQTVSILAPPHSLSSGPANARDA